MRAAFRRIALSVVVVTAIGRLALHLPSIDRCARPLQPRCGRSRARAQALVNAAPGAALTRLLALRERAEQARPPAPG